MRESGQKDATLRIYESDKFEVTSCMWYCSRLLRNITMSPEFALLYLELPPSVLAAEVDQPLIDAAKKYLVAHCKNFKVSKEEVIMGLPLCAVEVVLVSSGLRVDEEDNVLDFVLEWARAHYPKLEERREVLTKRLAQCICFYHMSCSKLKEVLVCPDFDHEAVTKNVLEALFLKKEVPYSQHINASKELATNKCSSLGRYYNLRPIKVVHAHFDFSQPRCVVYFDLKKEECENLFQSSSEDSELYTQSFCLGGRLFYLRAECNKEEHDSFGLYRYKEGNSESCTVDFEFAVIKKSSKEFQQKCGGEECFSDIPFSWGFDDLFEIPWIDFMSNDSEYFIDGILHLRADITITDTED